MSQSFENPSFNPPPPKKSGMSTLMIVLIVLGLGGLVCCGACGTCTYFAYNVGTKMIDDVVRKVAVNQAAKDAFGEPMTPGVPTVQAVGETITLDFPISGPKGSGQVHAEGKSGPNGFEASKIIVTLPNHQTINVSGQTDPTDINIPDVPEIEMDDAK